MSCFGDGYVEPISVDHEKVRKEVHVGDHWRVYAYFQLCQLVAIHVMEYKEAQVRVTISASATTFKPTTDTFDDLLNRADQALYLAKPLGKNRLEVA